MRQERILKKPVRRRPHQDELEQLTFASPVDTTCTDYLLAAIDELLAPA